MTAPWVDPGGPVHTLVDMVTNSDVSGRLGTVSALVVAYAAGMVGTVVALAILSGAAPGQAPQEAWGHAVIVTVLAFVLLMRLRSARAGSARALMALGVIAAVLLVANVVEASLPGAFPGWMRVEMGLIAVLMAAVLVAPRRATTAGPAPDEAPGTQPPLAEAPGTEA